MRVSRSGIVTRKKFAKLLKDYRERRRFTQEDAAKHLGVSLRTLQNWEIARNMPRGFGLRALVTTLEKGRK
jgi:DNA-binding transcriptional regulator YiaG